MTERELIIRAFWDDEAKVWVAESDDVPGLVTEADTIGGLMQRLAELIPELLELNAPHLLADELTFTVEARITGRTARLAA